MPESSGGELAIPLPAEGANSKAFWLQQLSASKDNLKAIRTKYKWNVNVDRYTLSRDTVDLRSGPAVLLPKDYSYTEQKIAQLFFQTPEVTVSAARPDVSADSAVLMQSVLNDLVKQLGAKYTVEEILRDVLVPAGVGIAVLGYEAFTDPVQPTVPIQVGQQPAIGPDGQPVLQPGAPMVDPVTRQPGPPQMVPVMEPVYEDAPYVVRERWFIERKSPLDFLWPTEFRGMDWAKASWLGVRHRVSKTIAKLVYHLDDEQLERYTSGTEYRPDENDSLSPDRGKQVFDGIELIEIWYRAIDVDPSIGDPDLIRQLVLLRGETPILHRDSPYQDILEGRVTGGLMRFPIYPLTLRYVPDCPIPPSDCSMSRVIVDELSKGRTQMLEQRDRNKPLRWIDTDKITPESKEKVLSGQTQELIPMSGLDTAARDPIGAIQQSSFPDENFNFNNYGERDLQECWALSAQNLGTTGTSGRTATELSIANSATESRLEAERIRVMVWWGALMEGLAALVQRYAPDPQTIMVQGPDGRPMPMQVGAPLFTNVLGPDGSKRLVAWSKQDIAGEFAFDIRPDSSRRVDQAAERKFRVDVFNLLANDPTINRQELVRWLAPTLGLDPEKLFKPPAPPPQPEAKSSISMSIRSEDLLGPAAPTLLAVMQQNGILKPQAPPQGPPGQPPMGGGPQPTAPVNKHSAERTGNLPGNGSGNPQP